MELIWKNISKYRTILMVIAMLWVVLHHCNCLTHYTMFMFLSGFGIYFSLEKHPDILQFLVKRIKRLFFQDFLLEDPFLWFLSAIALLIEKFDSIWESNPMLKILNYIGKNNLTIYAVDNSITDYMQMHCFLINLAASDKQIDSLTKKSGNFIAI